MISDVEYEALKERLKAEGKQKDVTEFLEFMKALRRYVESQSDMGQMGHIAMLSYAGQAVAESDPRRRTVTAEEFEKLPGAKVSFKAEKYSEMTVKEHHGEGKGLKDYLQLPASQYSTNVLRAKTVTRLDDDTFQCELDPINFFGQEVWVPTLTFTKKQNNGW